MIRGERSETGLSERQRVKIYGKEDCIWCTRAKEYLDNKKIPYDYFDINVDVGTKEYIISLGAKTVPAILINDIFIGGYTNLLERI